MAKEVKQEILNIYCETDKGVDYNGEETSVALCQIKWNGREPKGYDIRTLKNGKAYKGISISYDGLEKIVMTAIAEELVSIDAVKNAIEKNNESVFKIDDFKDLFSGLNKDDVTAKRDSLGRIVNKNGSVIISRMR